MEYKSKTALYLGRKSQVNVTVTVTRCAFFTT